MVEKRSENGDVEATPEEQGEINTTCQCVDCKSRISVDAHKCPVCHSFQHRGRHFMTLAPSLSLIVAIIALLPATVNLLVSSLSDKSPRYNVLTFYPNNIAGENGEMLQPVDFSINAQVTNLSDETLIVDDSLTCATREGVQVAEELLSTEEPQSLFPEPIIVAPSGGFELYFENSEKTVIPARSTQTVSWSVRDEQYVELYGWSTTRYGGETTFSETELELFYDAILAEFADVRELSSNDHFPRGALIEEEEVVSFFLNLDCSFDIENSSAIASEELHLEFVFEFSGDTGVFPRWRIGKNIGGGFGNGFGNGSD